MSDWSVAHLWPISWAIVKAVESPMSSVTLQLFCGLHAPPSSAIPEGRVRGGKKGEKEEGVSERGGSRREKE